MKNKVRFLTSSLVLIALLLTLPSCSLDIANPNSPTDADVLSTSQGVMGLAIGIQQFYSVSVLQNMVLTPGLTSREITVNRTFSDLIELETGGTGISDQNANILNLWSNSLKVVSMADQIVSSAPSVPMNEGTRSGVLSIAYLFKAMALGALAESFEEAPITVSQTTPPDFKTRTEVLTEALRLLDLSSQVITITPVSSEFNTRVLGSGLNLQNTISAYEARYNLMLGQYQKAIDAANAVSPTVASKFVFDDKSRNPIYDAVTGLGRWAPIDNFGTSLTDTNDARLKFYMTPSSAVSNPGGLPIDILKGFFDDPLKAIPVYLPGEMNLIKAEAYIRLNDLTSAVNEINVVRTKTAAQDPFGVGANLPAYSGTVQSDSLLQEVYRQRCAELFWSGLRLEDSRRLGRPGPGTAGAERNRNYYPYPYQERLNNKNTPANPSI